MKSECYDFCCANKHFCIKARFLCKINILKVFENNIKTNIYAQIDEYVYVQVKQYYVTKRSSARAINFIFYFISIKNKFVVSLRLVFETDIKTSPTK